MFTAMPEKISVRELIELDGRGLSNVELCLQYVTDKQDEEIVYFTIEGGEVIYFVLDEQ